MLGFSVQGFAKFRILVLGACDFRVSQVSDIVKNVLVVS